MPVVCCKGGGLTKFLTPRLAHRSTGRGLAGSLITSGSREGDVNFTWPPHGRMAQAGARLPTTNRTYTNYTHARSARAARPAVGERFETQPGA